MSKERQTPYADFGLYSLLFLLLLRASYSQLMNHHHIWVLLPLGNINQDTTTTNYYSQVVE